MITMTSENSSTPDGELSASEETKSSDLEDTKSSKDESLVALKRKSASKSEKSEQLKGMSKNEIVNEITKAKVNKIIKMKVHKEEKPRPREVISQKSTTSGKVTKKAATKVSNIGVLRPKTCRKRVHNVISVRHLAFWRDLLGSTNQMYGLNDHLNFKEVSPSARPSSSNESNPLSATTSAIEAVELRSATGGGESASPATDRHRSDRRDRSDENTDGAFFVESSANIAANVGEPSTTDIAAKTPTLITTIATVNFGETNSTSGMGEYLFQSEDDDDKLFPKTVLFDMDQQQNIEIAPETDPTSAHSYNDDEISSPFPSGFEVCGSSEIFDEASVESLGDSVAAIQFQQSVNYRYESGFDASGGNSAVTYDDTLATSANVFDMPRQQHLNVTAYESAFEDRESFTGVGEMYGGYSAMATSATARESFRCDCCDERCLANSRMNEEQTGDIAAETSSSAHSPEYIVADVPNSSPFHSTYESFESAVNLDGSFVATSSSYAATSNNYDSISERCESSAATEGFADSSATSAINSDSERRQSASRESEKAAPSAADFAEVPATNNATVRNLFRCDQCDEHFLIKVFYELHMWRAHLRCHLCDFRGDDENALTAHAHEEHPLPPSPPPFTHIPENAHWREACNYFGAGREYGEDDLSGTESSSESDNSEIESALFKPTTTAAKRNSTDNSSEQPNIADSAFLSDFSDFTIHSNLPLEKERYQTATSEGRKDCPSRASILIPNCGSKRSKKRPVKSCGGEKSDNKHSKSSRKPKSAVITNHSSESSQKPKSSANNRRNKSKVIDEPSDTSMTDVQLLAADLPKMANILAFSDIPKMRDETSNDHPIKRRRSLPAQPSKKLTNQNESQKLIDDKSTRRMSPERSAITDIVDSALEMHTTRNLSDTQNDKNTPSKCKELSAIMVVGASSLKMHTERNLTKDKVTMMSQEGSVSSDVTGSMKVHTERNLSEKGKSARIKSQEGSAIDVVGSVLEMHTERNLCDTEKNKNTQSQSEEGKAMSDVVGSVFEMHTAKGISEFEKKQLRSFRIVRR